MWHGLWLIWRFPRAPAPCAKGAQPLRQPVRQGFTTPSLPLRHPFATPAPHFAPHFAPGAAPPGFFWCGPPLPAIGGQGSAIRKSQTTAGVYSQSIPFRCDVAVRRALARRCCGAALLPHPAKQPRRTVSSLANRLVLKRTSRWQAVVTPRLTPVRGRPPRG